MSYAPQVPPLPHDYHPPRRQDSKPPIPPLPPNFHPEQPLAAPMPERIMPSLPADMARTLDESVNYGSASRTSSLAPSYTQDYRRPSPGLPPGAAYPGGYPGGFAPPSAYGAPQRTGPSPAPYRLSPNASPYGSPPFPNGAGGGFATPPPQPHNPHYSLNSAMSGMAISQPPPRSSSAQPYPSYQPQHAPQHPQYASQHAPPPASPPHPGRAPDLTARIPTLESLAAAQRALPPRPSPEHVPWVRDVLFLVDRVVAQDSPGGAPQDGVAVSLPDPTLARLAADAVAALLAVAGAQAPPPEALYLRGTLSASGAFPAQLPHSPRDAFRDFEAAARAGFVKAWFKLGRDYEAVGDVPRARDCFERGVRGGVESCFYRMGMANLLGQLGLPASPPDALPLLHRAATLASTDTPQPAYVYGLLLLGEFSHVRLDERLFAPFLPQGTAPAQEARKFVERAAFLGFAPAQYKLGHAYEYAVAPFPFDPLLSVQYYSLASQQGEPEADMALSKWFLCGAEGAFEKDEALAWTFADKAAHKGLASAEFAMGYYAEVGVGGRKDVEAARKWYAKAVEHGNTDAPDRLAALSQPTPQALSRTEHDAITDAKLVRKHTQARVNAQAAGRHGGGGAASGAVIGRIQAQAQQQQQQPMHSPPHSPPQQAMHSPPQHQHSLPPSHSPPHHQPPAHHQSLPPQPQHAPANAPRYSLTDAPSPAGSPVPSAPHSSTRPAGRPPGRRPGPGSPHPGQLPGPHDGGHESPALPPPGPKPAGGAPGPATFAEMGFQTGKAADKECRIM